jgi:hypothetical protein
MAAVRNGLLLSRQAWPRTKFGNFDVHREEINMTHLRRSMRKVFRGTSWLKSVGRYRETFSRVFRAGTWRYG